MFADQLQSHLGCDFAIGQQTGCVSQSVANFLCMLAYVRYDTTL
jgi:hypothetical protein